MNNVIIQNSNRPPSSSARNTRQISASHGPIAGTAAKRTAAVDVSQRSHGSVGSDVPPDQTQTEAHSVFEFCSSEVSAALVDVLLPSYTAAAVDRREVLKRLVALGLVAPAMVV